MRIIPAIDIINGKCVRLTKGDYSTKKVYNENPLEVAKEFEDNGFKHLHLVDLDGAKANRIINHKVIYEISTKTNLNIDFGGGLKSINDVETAFNNGAKQITLGSMAVSNPTLFCKLLEKYGPDKIILGADANNRQIATNGWTNTTELDIMEFINHYTKKGIEYVICTDIHKDGMLQGPSISMYKEILNQFNIRLIASGGIATINDLDMLKNIGCEGAIVGKAIYEKRITLSELQRYIE
jgi:phosphoribosylformimino-5-aminoimidazole carboxamide ribotide isomerase